jgi:hypothetical protein
MALFSFNAALARANNVVCVVKAIVNVRASFGLTPVARDVVAVAEVCEEVLQVGHRY